MDYHRKVVSDEELTGAYEEKLSPPQGGYHTSLQNYFLSQVKIREV